MNAAHLLVKALESEGVEYIFALPGEENLDVLEAIRTSSIKYIGVRHEQAGGFMAATYGRLTGKPGVCLSTLGPGATNFVTAAAFANLGGMPMIMITGQKPIKSSKQGNFQIVNVVDLMKPITKMSTQIINSKAIPARVREAFRIAAEERPGAVLLELPEDIAAEEVEDTRLFPVNKIRRPAADPKAVAEAVRLIEKAKSPLILVGAGANRKLVSNSLQRFLDKTGIPFFNTQMGKGVIDERSSQYLGTAALSDNDFLHCAVERADLIINVGHDVIEKPPFIMKHPSASLRAGNLQKVIHINFFSAVVNEIYFPQWEVIGDIGNALWQMTELIDKKKCVSDFSYFFKIKTQLEAHIEEHSGDNNFPIIPQRLVASVRRVMSVDGIVALDNGMYKLWFARNYKTYERNTLLLDNALATMGAGLPGAIAARLVYPDRKVLAVCGDGGFMMNSQELETAVRLRLNLTVLILNDNGYGMIKWKQNAGGFAKYGLELGNPDFVKYAESYGAAGHRVTNAEELEPMLKKCLETDGVHVVEVPVDYSENERVFTKELRERACLL